MKLCFVSVNGPREPYLLDNKHTDFIQISNSGFHSKYCIVSKNGLGLTRPLHCEL
jgi:hypothetical protein